MDYSINWETCKSCPWAYNDENDEWICDLGDEVREEDLIKADEEGTLIDCDIVAEAAFEMRLREKNKKK